MEKSIEKIWTEAFINEQSLIAPKINNLYNSGEYIILYTSRGSGSGKDWRFFTQKQIKSWGVMYHELLLGKPQYDIFVDDRAINNEEWYKENNIKVTE